MTTMLRGLFCGALLALWLPLSWRFLAATCGDTPMLWRVFVFCAIKGFLLAFIAATRISAQKRPHTAILAVALTLIAISSLFPLLFADSIFNTWQQLLFFNAHPNRVLTTTLLWGGTAGFINGLAAGLLAGSLPTSRKLLPILLGVVAMLVLRHILPVPSFEVTLRTAALLLALFVASLAFCHGRRKIGGFVLLACVAALGALLFVKDTNKTPLLSRGPFGYWAAADSGFIPLRLAPVARGESATHHFAVFDTPPYGQVVTLTAMPYYTAARFRAPHTLAAVIPFLRAPNAKNAAFIGDFAPRTAVAAEALPLEVLYVWEPLAGLFTACGGSGPSWRIALRVGNGRAAFNAIECWFYGYDNLDIIVVDPGPLWRRDALDWFTPSTFRKLHRQLSPDGIAAIRLDGRGLTPLMLQRILARFMDVGFNDVCLWNIGLQDYLLTGGLQIPELEAALDALDEPLLLRELANAGVQGLPDALSTLLLDHAAATAFVNAPAAESVRLSPRRAWRALFDSEAPAHLLETLARFQAQELTWSFSGSDALDLHDTLADRMDEAIEARLTALPGIRAYCTNDLASALAPLHASRLAWPRLPLLYDLGDRIELTGRLVAADDNWPLAYKYFFMLQLLRPTSPGALCDFAQALRKLGRDEEAYAVLSRAAALAPGMTALRFEKAALARQLQKWGDARDDYESVLEDNPANIVALTELANLLARNDTPLHDIKRAVVLAEHAAKITQFKEPLAVITLGNIYILAGRVADGVKLKQAFRKQQQ